MPALDTVQDYITECRRLLQDVDMPYRYPNADLVAALNIGFLEVRRLRADLLLTHKFVPPFFDVSGLGTPVPFEPMYRPSLVYYIVGRAQLRDDEPTTDARAGALLQKFTQQLLVAAS